MASIYAKKSCISLQSRSDLILDVGHSLWQGRKVPTKSSFEQEAPKIGTQKCSTKQGVREPLHVEFALSNRELVKAEEFEKRVFEQMTPLKWRK